MKTLMEICLFFLMCFICVVSLIEVYKNFRDFKFRHIITNITQAALAIFCGSLAGFLAYHLVCHFYRLVTSV